MDNFYNSLSKEELIEVLKRLPINIFSKDAEGKYEFSSNYHIENENIIGKTSLDTNKDKETAKKSYEIDKKIIATGIGADYIKEEIINGEKRYINVTKNPIFDENGKVIRIAGYSVDVTQTIQQVFKDDLTGVYNRNYLTFFLDNKNTTELYPLVIFSIDCNDLKVINDKYGHLGGDQYLKYTAEILKSAFPLNSVVARTGGDEFIVILPNSTEKQALEYLKGIKLSADKIRIFDSSLSIAIGFSLVNNYISNLDENIDLADKAMYKDKKIYKRSQKQKRIMP